MCAMVWGSCRLVSLEETEDGTFRLSNAGRNRLTVEYARGRGDPVTPHGASDIPRHHRPDVRGGIQSLHRCRIRIISPVQSARRRGAGGTGAGRRVRPSIGGPTAEP